jgi:hypothetical protein
MTAFIKVEEALKELNYNSNKHHSESYTFLRQSTAAHGPAPVSGKFLLARKTFTTKGLSFLKLLRRGDYKNRTTNQPTNPNIISIHRKI